MKALIHTTQIRRLLVGASSAAALVLLASCGSSNNNGDGDVRVIHASPDAPAVNIFVNGDEVISNLDYAEVSAFLTVEEDDYDIVVEGILPGDNLAVIEVDDFPIDEDDQISIVAINNVAEIDALVVLPSEAEPTADEVAVNVVHAAPVAGTIDPVDVYVTAPGEDISVMMPALTFDIGETRDAGALTAGVVEIQVAFENSDDVVYNSGPVDLAPFAGESILLIAVETENATSGTASPVKILAVTDTAVIELLDADTTAGAKVVHASPDATALAGGPVEVFATSAALGVDPVELIDAFDYTDIIPGADSTVAVPAADDYAFDVAPNSDMIGDSVFNVSGLTLAAGSEYTVVAAGRVGGDPAFSLLLTEDDNRAVATQARVKVVHAAPAAGDVRVFVTPAGDFSELTILNEEPLLSDFSFGTITEDYVDVAPGNYDIRVVAAGDLVAINIEDLPLPAGLVATAIAIGPSESGGDQMGFDLLLVTN